MSIRHLVPATSLRCALACAALTLAAGCAAVGEQTPEAAVTLRSEQYLKARQAGDVDAAYALLAPSYRAIKSKERFQAENGAATLLKGGELVAVQCEDVRCTVRRNFLALVPMMGGAEVPMSVVDAWVLQDGQWWLFLE